MNYLTLTVMTNFFFPDCTVIFAVPRFKPFMIPFDDIETIRLFELLYVIFSLDVNGVSIGFNVYRFPTCKERVFFKPEIFVVFTGFF